MFRALLGLTFIALVGCSRLSDTEKRLVGTWVMSSDPVVHIDGEPKQEEDPPPHDSERVITCVFRSDRTFMQSGPAFPPVTGKWRVIDGDLVTDVLTGIAESDPGSSESRVLAMTRSSSPTARLKVTGGDVQSDGSSRCPISVDQCWERPGA